MSNPDTPLWQQGAALPEDPAQALAAAHDFVTRCRAWAIDEIARREADGKPTHAWQSYLQFTDHTLRELEDGTLDRWFQRGPSP